MEGGDLSRREAQCRVLSLGHRGLSKDEGIAAFPQVELGDVTALLNVSTGGPARQPLMPPVFWPTCPHQK